MAQKYRIYINQRVVLITETAPLQPESYEQLVAATFDIKQQYARLNHDGLPQYYYVLCEDAKAFLKKVLKTAPLIKAAGGLVKNHKGNHLFIFRNGKWDLPKGKMEKGEKPKESGVREVEEECGIKIDKCGKKIINTYHVYNFKGEVVIKKTYWFKMKYKGKAKLVPQTEEGITDVKWLNRSHIATAIDNTYPSIIDVLWKQDLLTNIPVPLSE